MVADEVVVETRRAGAAQAWSWSSDGKGAYTIAPLALDRAPIRGARVILHLNAASADYADPHRLERIVREHSGAVAVPIDLIDKPGAEPRRIADGAAIWAKPKSDVTAENYTEFYRGLSGQYDEPALTIHWRAEGVTNIRCWRSFRVRGRSTCSIPCARAAPNSMSGAC